jgi:hypothetical protein
MKPYQNQTGKGKWAYFWGDKVLSKIKIVFKKSARQDSKKIIKQRHE